jgi:alpha-1,3-rhamnosyl/mannosyltransferase
MRHSARAYRDARLDVVWLPNFTWPPRTDIPLVSTIHDVIEFRIPGKFDPHRVLYRKRAVPRMARRSDHVLTVSETSRRDIMDLFGIPPEKVTVIPNGVSDDFSPDQAARFREVEAQLGVERPYILFVGTLDHPGKNAATLLAAFARCRGRLPPGIRLVLAGKPGKGHTELRAIAGSLGLDREDSGVLWLGFVAEQLLPPLYAGAAAVVFPSLYEGFGLCGRWLAAPQCWSRPPTPMPSGQHWLAY